KQTRRSRCSQGSDPDPTAGRSPSPSTANAAAGSWSYDSTSRGRFEERLGLVTFADAFRDRHPPSVQDQLAHLGFLDRLEADQHPVVSEITATRLHELGGIAAHEPTALLLGKGKAHHLFVA